MPTVRFLPAVALLVTLSAMARGADGSLAWESLSTEAGLPQISVHAMQRDAEGLLWVGTENGLARFDGTRFRVHRVADTPELGSNWITALLLDQRGRLWIGTQTGLAWREANGSFHTPTGADGLPVRGLAEEEGGGVLVVAGQLRRVDGKGRLAHADDHAGSIEALVVAEGGTWVASGGTVSRLGGNDRHALPAGTLVRALHVHRGELLAATTTGLYRLTEGATRWPGIPAGDVRAVATARDGALWVVGGGRIWRLADGEPAQDLASPGFPAPISLLVDGDSVWVGSQQAGLRRYWPQPIRVHAEDLGLADPRSWCLARLDGEVLVGTDAGVAVARDGGFRSLVPQLSGVAVYSLYVDHRRSLWIGGRNGLWRRDPDGVLVAIDEVGSVQVNGFAEVAGRLLVATATGLYASEGGALARVDFPGTSAVRALLPRGASGLWVGTQAGLWLQAGEGDFRRVGEELLDRSFITALAEWEGRLLVGTYDRGIAIGEHGRWRWLDSRNGLPGDNVFHLSLTDTHLLASHGHGVWRLPLAALTAGGPVAAEVLLHDAGDDPRRSRIRCCNGAGQDKGLVHDGAIWLPTLAGPLRLPLDLEVSRVPPVRLSLPGADPLPEASVLRMPRGRRDLIIELAAEVPGHFGRLRFRARLLPEGDWVELSGPQVHYGHLAAGSYRIEAAAAREGEAFGPAGSLRIEVPPFWYEHPGVRWLAFLLGVGTVILAWRWRVASLHRRRVDLEREVRARTRDLELARRRLEAANLDLARASVTDELTGLPNRRHLMAWLPEHLPSLRRLTLVLVDLDHFKQVNDTYGHATGDEVLRAVADCLRATLRGNEQALRWGGEEFLLVLPDIAPDLARRRVRDLRQRIAADTSARMAGIRISASLGFIDLPMAGLPLQPELCLRALNLADLALYAAKEAGRDRAATLRPGLTLALDPADLGTGRLQQLLADGHFEVEFDP